MESLLNLQGALVRDQKPGLLTPGCEFVDPAEPVRHHHPRIRSRLLICSNCNTLRAERRHREDAFSFLVSCFGYLPYKCRRCLVSQYRVTRPWLLLAWLVFGAMFVMIFGYSLAAANVSSLWHAW